MADPSRASSSDPSPGPIIIRHALLLDSDLGFDPGFHLLVFKKFKITSHNSVLIFYVLLLIFAETFRKVDPISELESLTFYDLMKNFEFRYNQMSATRKPRGYRVSIISSHSDLPF